MEAVYRIIHNRQAEFTFWPNKDSTRSYPRAEQETILLTGASGSLGTSLLATLSASPSVSKIYAMVRGPNNIEKLRISFERRGLDPSILTGGKIEVLNLETWKLEPSIDLTPGVDGMDWAPAS